MDLREFVLENLIGDLSYHPQRGLIYLGLGTATLSIWIFAGQKLNVIPLVFGLGSVGLFLRGIFFLRKTSAGLTSEHQALGINGRESIPRPGSAAPKTFPPGWALTAQMIQDFGTGVLVLGEGLHRVMRENESVQFPSIPVLLVGGVLLGGGWLIRHLKT